MQVTQSSARSGAAPASQETEKSLKTEQAAATLIRTEETLCRRANVKIELIPPVCNTLNDRAHETVQLEMFPSRPVGARWPSRNTLPAEALSRLLAGERLTQPAFGTSRWRLAAYIMKLKYLGWPVNAALVRHPGRTRPIAQYWLEAEVISAVRVTARRSRHMNSVAATISDLTVD